MDETICLVRPSMQSVRTLGAREREGTFRLLFGQERPGVFRRCPQMEWVDRLQADKVDICFRASKADKKRIGAVMTRTRV